VSLREEKSGILREGKKRRGLVVRVGAPDKAALEDYIADTIALGC